MTPERDTFLFVFWTLLEAAFIYLWVTTLLKWWAYRDGESPIYFALYLLLSFICGINSVIRSGIYNFDTQTLIAVQRAFWFGVMITCFMIAHTADVRRSRARRIAADIRDMIAQQKEMRLHE